MKTYRNPKHRGVVSTAMVITIAFVMIAGLTFTYRSQIRSLEGQSKAQIKIDYAQKEEALLKALLYTVPNKAIGAMQSGSAVSPENHSWERAFQEAIALANAETAIDADILDDFGVTGLISANTGDTQIAAVSDLVAPAIPGGGGMVNPGNTRESGLLLDAALGDKLPAPLWSDTSIYNSERTHPIVSFGKTHSGSWTKGLLLSPDDYPLYNLYTYPNIRFGYARPGEPFVAKRNWWAFSLTFGGASQGQGGAAPIQKNYIYSIYEVPSQLPMSAAGFMSVGRHEDGTAWNQATLSGGVFANELETEGTVALNDGLFSARGGITFSDSTSVAGRNLTNNFNALGVREAREAQTGADFHDASLAGDVGRVAFIPLNQGTDFLLRQGDGTTASRISPTGWNDYSRGAEQANMWVQIWAMDSVSNQMPTEIRFRYRRTNGNNSTVTFTRGVNWPTESETGGDVFPFQTTLLPVGRNALTVYLDRLPAFLASQTDAADLTVNHSLYIFPQNNQATVVPPSIPSVATDPAVSVRGAADMTAYTRGFSVVTNLRMYIGESLNIVPMSPPAGSGLDPATEYFPPVSLFAPEKRFGETPMFSHPVEFAGQLNSLNTSSTTAFRPLDLRSGSDDAVAADRIEADLRLIRSPAELPPIHLMNWLVTIEEIHP